MKTIKMYLIVFATFLLMPVLLKAQQWQVVRWDSINTFSKVFAATPYTVFVVGNGQFILRTNDGGTTWDSITANNLNNIQFTEPFFLDKDNGFIGGTKNGKQVLFKTTDNGNTWTDITPNPPSPYSISSIYFIDPMNGYAFSKDTLYKTMNGGIGWTLETPAFYIDIINNLYFIDINNGFATGSDWVNGLVMKTSDAGKTWSTSLKVPGSGVSKLDFINPNIGFTSGTSVISGASVIYRTQNGGNSWDTIPAPNFYIMDFDFISANVGHVLSAGAGGSSDLWLTVDGGQNWTLKYTTGWNMYGAGVSLYAISFSGGVGYAVGDNGLIKKYDDDNTSGIQKETSNIAVSVYPNPFTTKAIIDISSEIKNGLLTIYDFSGREIKNINFSGKQLTIERENLENGIYFYQIIPVAIGTEQKITATGKLIVQ